MDFFLPAQLFLDGSTAGLCFLKIALWKGFVTSHFVQLPYGFVQSTASDKTVNLNQYSICHMIIRNGQAFFFQEVDLIGQGSYLREFE